MKVLFREYFEQSDIDFLTQKINEETLEFGSAYPFGFFIKNEREEIIAGANGSIVFGAIYTDQLWVHPSFRGIGLGQKLMKHIEDYGHLKGCTMATVATMSFQQAQDFYKKLGYKIDFKRKGYVGGSFCFYMKKDL